MLRSSVRWSPPPKVRVVSGWNNQAGECRNKSVSNTPMTPHDQKYRLLITGPSCFPEYLHSAETDLRFVHKIRTKNRDFVLEARKNRLANPKRLNGPFIGSGEKMFVRRSRNSTDFAKAQDFTKTND